MGERHQRWASRPPCLPRVAVEVITDVDTEENEDSLERPVGQAFLVRLSLPITHERINVFGYSGRPTRFAPLCRCPYVQVLQGSTASLWSRL